MFKSRTLNYLQKRERGCRYGSRKQNIDLDQVLLTQSKLKHSKIASVSSPNDSKALLITVSVDKKSFAVAMGDNSIGIFCSISGELKYKLLGPKYTIYTISWHPNIPNTIASSDLSGSVFVWEICGEPPVNQPLSITTYIYWNYRPFHSLSYSLCFHPFTSIMTIARDREIRFVNWKHGGILSVWRFYSEFSWVPWVQWSYVGNSILVSIGNSHNKWLSHSLHEIINEDDNLLKDMKTASPLYTGCEHADGSHNEICLDCDSCAQMTQLDQPDPEYSEYKVNCVDLIRYVLSQSQEWFAKNYICVDCRVRFCVWSSSIALVQNNGSTSNCESPKKVAPQKLPYDVDTKYICVLEAPVAPELVYNSLQSQAMFSESKEMQAECREMIRCVAMFERECLRRNICWYCIQQLHQWLTNIHDDLKWHLYTTMILLRRSLNRKVTPDGLSDIGESEERKIHPECLKISLENILDLDRDLFRDRLGVSEEEVSAITRARHIQEEELMAFNTSQFIHEDDDDEIEIDSMCTSSYNTKSNQADTNDDDDVDESNEEPPKKRSLYHRFPVLPPKKRKTSIRSILLRRTLKLLQLYTSTPTNLGDIIDIMSSHNTRSTASCHPYLNVSKIESYSIRRFHIQPIVSDSGGNLEIIRPTTTHPHQITLVPDLVFSSTGLTAPSIRLSHCGRKLAVLVRPDTLKLNATIHKGPPMIAVYAVEPDNYSGQLLHYCQLPYDSISIDFNSLDDKLLVGLSQHHHHPSWIFSSILPHSEQVLSPTNHNTSRNFQHSQSTSSVIAAFVELNPEPVYENDKSSVQHHPKSMCVIKYLTTGSAITDDTEEICDETAGALSCVVWNNAGGLLYSRSHGNIYNVNYIGSVT